MSNQGHPHSNMWFRENRSEIYKFSIKIISSIFEDEKRNILVSAPVKSGKREIVECISTAVEADVKVIYITAFIRKDVKQQAEELGEYGIEIATVPNKKSAEEIISGLEYHISMGRRLILCIDECDYGSGSSQSMSVLTSRFLKDENVVKIWISATPEEVESSTMRLRDDYEFLKFEPPITYIGAKHFIDNELVHEAEKFFVKEEGDIILTSHAKKVLRDRITSIRNIACVRITGRDTPISLFTNKSFQKSICSQLKASMSDGKNWELNIIEADSSFEWENRRNRMGYTSDKEINYLFVMFQTCTRGTDLKGWHPHIAVWHDSRKGANLNKAGRSNLNTLVQALLRVSHYTSMEGYGGIAQDIHVYADIHVMEYAKNNDMGIYLEVGGKPPARTSIGKKSSHITSYTFVPCTIDTYYEHVRNGELGNGGENPFTNTDEYGVYMGYIRGEWKVRTFDEVASESWGINPKTRERRIPCYNDGICGVAYGKYISTVALDDDIKTGKSSMFEKFSQIRQ
jgi:hypothetical protein